MTKIIEPKSIKYACKRHKDIITGDYMHVWSKELKIDTRYCLLCLNEMMAKHCEILDKIEDL